MAFVKQLARGSFTLHQLQQAGNIPIGKGTPRALVNAVKVAKGMG